MNHLFSVKLPNEAWWMSTVRSHQLPGFAALSAYQHRLTHKLIQPLAPGQELHLQVHQQGDTHVSVFVLTSTLGEVAAELVEVVPRESDGWGLSTVREEVAA